MAYYEIQILPLIIGLVAVFKRIGIPNKYLPLMSLLIGLLFSFLLEDTDWKESILKGLFLGLSSVGLYSSSKTLIVEKKGNIEEEST
jgi:hypothetical protein